MWLGNDASYRSWRGSIVLDSNLRLVELLSGDLVGCSTSQACSVRTWSVSLPCGLAGQGLGWLLCLPGLLRGNLVSRSVLLARLAGTWSPAPRRQVSRQILYIFLCAQAHVLDVSPVPLSNLCILHGGLLGVYAV
jgi:hypothetical protein